MREVKWYNVQLTKIAFCTSSLVTCHRPHGDIMLISFYYTSLWVFSRMMQITVQRQTQEIGGDRNRPVKGGGVERLTRGDDKRLPSIHVGARGSYEGKAGAYESARHSWRQGGASGWRRCGVRRAPLSWESSGARRSSSRCGPARVAGRPTGCAVPLRRSSTIASSFYYARCHRYPARTEYASRWSPRRCRMDHRRQCVDHQLLGLLARDKVQLQNPGASWLTL